MCVLHMLVSMRLELLLVYILEMLSRSTSLVDVCGAVGVVSAKRNHCVGSFQEIILGPLTFG